MRIEFFVLKKFTKTSPYAGTQKLRQQLLKERAIVVYDDDKYIGVISANDLAKSPHNLVIDSLTEKEPIPYDCKISDALDIMKKQNVEVLPVWKEQTLLGLVFKNDILEYLNAQTCELETQVKERTKELEAAMAKAQESDRLKTAFLANLSHEIRTPLNGILGFSEFLSKPGLPDFKVKSYGEIINQSSRQLFAIIDSVLLMSQLDTGQITIQEKQIDIDHFFADLFAFYKPLTDNKSIELKLSLDSNNSPSILFDEFRVRQVMDNLVNNAIRNTSEGIIEIGYAIESEFIRFFVRDTGIGIKRELHSKIFERFQQAEVDYLKNFTGIGLGLSICKSLVELMGGKIGLQSKYHTGSDFYFTVPYKTKTSAANSEKPDSSAIGKAGGKGILIVDDEPINLILLETMLTDYDELKHQSKIKIYKACNGKEALRLCEQHQIIDIVLMDIKMPLMNGIEATKLIKKSRPEVKIIAQTAYNSEENKNEVFGAGCDDFITKPIKKEVLFQIIGKYISNGEDL